MSDPLSFFAGEDSSDSESEGENEPKEATEKAEEEDRPDKLPSPDTLFATVGRPSFLNTSLTPSDRDVNWDRFVKNDTEDNIHEDGAHAAVAPPTGLDDSRRNISSSLSIAIASTYTTPSHEISAAPVKYTNPKAAPDDDNGYGDDLDQAREEERAPPPGTKRAFSSVKDSENGVLKKKAKTDSFRQKEKRKCDTGQTSRGKSYVEEEKRILRQTFSTDEVMS